MLPIFFADLGNSPKPSPSVDSDIEKVNHILKREGHPESRFSRGGNDPSHHRPTQAHHQSNYNNPSSRDPPYREYRDRQDPHHQPPHSNQQAFRDQKSRQQYNRNRGEYPGDNMYPSNMNTQYRQPYQASSSYQQQNAMGGPMSGNMNSMGGGGYGGQQGNYQMQRQAGGNYPMNQQRQTQPNAYGNQAQQQPGFGMQQGPRQTQPGAYGNQGQYGQQGGYGMQQQNMQQQQQRGNMMQQPTMSQNQPMNSMMQQQPMMSQQNMNMAQQRPPMQTMAGNTQQMMQPQMQPQQPQQAGMVQQVQQSQYSQRISAGSNQIYPQAYGAVAPLPSSSVQVQQQQLMPQQQQLIAAPAQGYIPQANTALAPTNTALGVVQQPTVGTQLISAPVANAQAQIVPVISSHNTAPAFQTSQFLQTSHNSQPQQQPLTAAVQLINPLNQLAISSQPSSNNSLLAVQNPTNLLPQQITSLQPQIATLQTQPIIAGTSVAPSAVTFGTQQPIAVVQAPHQPHQVVVSGPAASMAAGPPIQILPAGPQALAVPPLAALSQAQLVSSAHGGGHHGHLNENQQLQAAAALLGSSSNNFDPNTMTPQQFQQMQLHHQQQHLKKMRQRLPHVSGAELKMLQKQIRDLQQQQQLQTLQTLQLAQKQEKQAFKYLNRAIKNRPSRTYQSHIYKV